MFKQLEITRQQIEKLKKSLKKSLSEAIQNLPDNPRITRLNGTAGPRAFTMSSRDLNNVWSPFYHDFKAQYKKLVEIVDKASLETVGTVLTRIIEKGNHPESGGTVKFHPDVIENLRGLLGLPESAPETKLSGPGM